MRSASRSVLAEYQKAPQVTRDRLYIDAMQQIYANVTKVMIDARSGANLLYLPLDKLLQQARRPARRRRARRRRRPPPADAPPAPAGAVDVRSRDGQRGRDREGR